MKKSTCLLLFGIIVAFSCYNFVRTDNELILSDQAIEDGVVSDVQEENEVEEPISNEPFIATNEWQVIKKNQAIPAGLHIRMNFQTGIKEAKLLEGTENKKTEEKEISNEETFHKIKTEKEGDSPKKTGPKIILADDIIKTDEGFSNEKLVFTKSHLKQALHNFKDKVGTKDIEHVTWSDDAKDALKETIDQEETVFNKNNFRTMKEIKEELEGKMGWNIKSDVQIMQDIIRSLKPESSTNEKIIALDNLEEYAHQFDNGKDLEKIGGLKLVVSLLNDSDEILQEKAANVIGAAAQSNKEVQDAVFNHGGLKLLIRMLDTSKLMLTQKKGLYAVSAVIRGDHQVQTEFVRLGGLKSILRILKQSTVNSLKVKAVALLYDLIVEQDEIMQKMIQSGKKKITDKSPLLNSLREAGWCETLLPLLQIEDFDAKEKVIVALAVSVESCQDVLKKDNVLKDLKHELKTLNDNIKSEDDADFKSYLVSLKEQLDENVIKRLTS